MTKGRLTMLKPRLQELPAARLPQLCRAGATERTTGRPWRRIRAAQLTRQPMCEHCAAAGVIELATEADHEPPLWRGGDDRRLRSLCGPCHRAKTAREAAERAQAGAS